MVLSARCEPNSRWICTPRSVGVVTRWRDSSGRASGARCVALLVWPFEWQSKQAAPRLGSSERRSSVWLNWVEDFTQFEQAGTYFDGDHVIAAKKGLNPLNRINQVDLMAEFQEELGFPPAPKLDVFGS